MTTINQAKIIKGLEQLSSKLDKTTFFFEFLKIYGFSKVTIQKLEQNDRTRNIGFNPGDYGLTKQVYFRSITDGDVNIELEKLLDHPSISQNKVRFVIVTDFNTLAAYDFLVEDSISIEMSDLRSNYDFFLPLTGKYEKPSVYSEHPADVKACEKMGRLYDIIKVLNHYDDSNLHSLNIFLTRLLFCFFAEDTGIFPIKGQMIDAMIALTKKDGSDLPDFFQDLFKVLDLPESSSDRRAFSATLQKFPYVNGGLFRESCEIPSLNAQARNILIDCGRLTWNEISPVIFGSMFQAVMDKELRHERGAHYTSEKNILKVIGPLFLDELKSTFENIRSIKTKSLKIKRLREFQASLSKIICLDPAAGCGNFLVIAFRELKQLELSIVVELLNIEEKTERSVFMDWTNEYSKVSINQFYGIEIEEFPVDIARVSMWLMEHVMNRKFGLKLGAVIPSIPLKNSAHIFCANALNIDWDKIIPIKDLNFVFGNPPFGGTDTTNKSQKEDLKNIFKGKRIGYLDYCAAWFELASLAMIKNPEIRCAFVSTNSIFQGEQVFTLWEPIFNRSQEIDFAHQSFQWRNEAKDNAGIHCCISGFSPSKQKKLDKRLFIESKTSADKKILEKKVNYINAYLQDAPNVIVKSISDPISPRPNLIFGNKPSAKAFILNESEYRDLKNNNSSLLPHIKKYIGAKELINGTHRYCIWLKGISIEDIKQNHELNAISTQVQLERSDNKGNPKPQHKGYPSHLFRQITQPQGVPCLVVPCVSSERRAYIPMAIVDENTIIANSAFVLGEPELFTVGLISSRMHMAWMRTVCGRLKSDYRYSRDLCYNTFPWPNANSQQKKVIENLAMNVLMAREMYPAMTLADLYDPNLMPPELLKAHHELDLAVDRLYRKRAFTSDEARLSHLFKRYEKLISGEDCSMLFEEEE